jgi:hypothetical protein
MPVDSRDPSYGILKLLRHGTTVRSGCFGVIDVPRTYVGVRMVEIARVIGLRRTVSATGENLERHMRTKKNENVCCFALRAEVTRI